MQNNPDNPARAVFDQWDRSHEGATRLVFVNSGGRSRLVLTASSDQGVAKALAPVIHKSIIKTAIDEAHTYAKAMHGARSKWPVHITIDRPAD